MNNSSDFGRRIKEARINLGLSQTALAKQTGLAQSSINNWENGKSLPTSSSLMKLVSVLGIPSQELTPYLLGGQPVFENMGTPSKKQQTKADEFLHSSQYPLLIEYYSALDTTGQKSFMTILHDFFQLNEEGKKEALKRVHELTLISTYQKNVPN